jgi:VWFA-related protein
MSRGCVAAIVLALAGTWATSLAGQSGAPRAPQSYTSTTTAILVDVVVRDKSGRPVTDLSATDFDVAEDGIAQRVDTFTRVSHGGGIGVGVAWRSPRNSIAATAAAAPPATAAATIDEATTALVFDHLSSESLRLAQKATLDYVPMSGESTVRVGVFATDPGIRVVQGYTTDRGRIRQAIDRVMASGVSAEEQKAERSDELMGHRRELEGQSQFAAAGAGSGTSALARNASELGARETELRMIQTELHMIRSFDNLDREHKGYDTSLALLAVVESLS